MFETSTLFIWLPIILVTITIHEFSHGIVADYLGDPTPRHSGRLTLNPLAHLDPIGFVLLILVHFGWAKPVPINPLRFSDPRRGMALVGLAGPFSNLVLAWLLSLLAKYLFPFFSVPSLLNDVMTHAIWLNLALAVFNFIPIPPLDGSRILAGILSPSGAAKLDEMERYGFVLVILLLFFPGTSHFIFGTVNFLFQVLMA